MPAGDYIGGAAVFLLMLAAVVVGARILLVRRLPHLRGSVRVLAFATLGTLGLLAVHLVPAILGVLGRGSVLASAALWLAGTWAVPAAPAKRAEPMAASEVSSGEGGFERLGAALAVALTSTFALAFLIAQAATPPTAIDTLTFHLPGVARWIETGSIWQVDNMVANVAHGNFPNNGDVVLLAAVLPWHNDFLSHLSMYPFYVLTGLAVYALARELRARPAIAAVASCLVLTIPAVALPALALSLVDALMLFSFLTGILFLVRHSRSGAASELLVAGLALGIAFGTKWYAVSSVAIVVAVWASASVLRRSAWRQVLSQAAVLIGVIALAGGVWLLRNWVETGNPILPVRVELLGTTIFDAPHDVLRETNGFTIADYLGDGGVWSEFILPQLRRALASPAGLIGVGFLLALCVFAWRPSRRPGGAWAPLAVVVGLLAVAYAITPYSAGGPEGQPTLVGADARYAVPAIALAAALVPTILSPRARAIALALGLVAMVDGIVWTTKLSSNYGQPSGADWFAAALVTATASGFVARLAVRRRLPGLKDRRAAAAAVLVAVVGAVAVGYPVQREFNDGRYLGSDPVLDQVIQASEDPQRIALAGEWDDKGLSPVFPAFGLRLDNEVEYLGDPEQGMLRPYPTRSEFIAALDHGDYDLVIVGPGRAPGSAGEEATWVNDAGFSELARSERLWLFGAPDRAAAGA
jgi:hypothetical protein